MKAGNIPALPMRLLKMVSAAPAERASSPLIRPDKPSWSLRGQADLHQQLHLHSQYSHLLQEVGGEGGVRGVS